MLSTVVIMILSDMFSALIGENVCSHLKESIRYGLLESHVGWL